MAEEGINEPRSDNPSDSTSVIDGIDINTAWREYIPEDMKDAGYFKTVTNLPQLLKNYGNAQKFISSSIRIPNDDATPEEWSAYYTKLGRPEKPEGYQISDIPNAEKLDADTIAWFKKTCHRYGVNQKGFQGIVDEFMKFSESKNKLTEEQMIEATRKAEEKMRDPMMWGANYDRNFALAKRAMTKLSGSESIVEKIERSGLGNEPEFLQMFAELGKRMAEHGIITGEVQGIATPQAAQAKVRELMNSDAYLNRSHPDHKSTVDEVQKLYQVAYDL